MPPLYSSCIHTHSILRMHQPCKSSMYLLAILATCWKGTSVCAIAVTLTFTTAMDSTDTSISEWVENYNQHNLMDPYIHMYE